jgi:hypothetical protein
LWLSEQELVAEEGMAVVLVLIGLEVVDEALVLS